MRCAPRLLTLCALLAAPNALASAKMKGTAKAHAIILTTNVPGANVFSDGMAVAHSGDAIDAAPGVQELVIVANGYVSRMTYIKVDPKRPQTGRFVGLLPAAKGKDGDLNFTKARKIAPRGALSALPSLCAQFNASGARMPAGLLIPCRRKTVLDDLALHGLGELRSITNDGSPLGRIRADLVSRVGQAANEEFYWRAEQLYSGLPSDESAITLLAYSAMLRGNCTRTSEILLETDASGLFSPGLAIVRGFCHELAGEAGDAVAALRQPFDRKRATPNALYYLARASWKTNFAVAESALKYCTQGWPTYYPCAEALAHAEALAGHPDVAAAALRTYLASAAVEVGKVATDATGKVGKDAALALYGQWPWIFEAAALKIAVSGGDPSSAGGLAIPLGDTLVASPAGMKRLVPTFEAARANAVLDVAYRILLATNPADATLLIKLAAVDRSLDKCEESLVLGERAMKLISDAVRKSALSITMSDCLTRLDRLDDAEKLLNELLETEPGLWKAQYNLGVVLQRLGKVDDAISHLNMALAGEAPPATRKRIEDMIGFLEAKKNPKPKK